MRTRVKVSGLLSAGEVRAAVGAGADALGFGQEARTEPPPWEAAAACPPGVSPVLHTSRPDALAIVEQAREAGVATVQLPPGLDPVVHVALRRAARDLKLVQALRMDEASADLARAYARLVDALLLELPRQVLTVADLDSPAEPRTVDWRRCRQVVQASAAPVWIAGGLTPGSVGEAVDQVNPFGVDVGSGVRTAGRLDARKLSSFFHAVRVAKIG
jgi:phosphoribosylanthranilate isomerase